MAGGEGEPAFCAEAGDAARLDVDEVASEAVDEEGNPYAFDGFGAFAVGGGFAVAAEDAGVLEEAVVAGDFDGERHGPGGALGPGATDAVCVFVAPRFGEEFGVPSADGVVGGVVGGDEDAHFIGAELLHEGGVEAGGVHPHALGEFAHIVGSSTLHIHDLEVGGFEDVEGGSRDGEGAGFFEGLLVHFGELGGDGEGDGLCGGEAGFCVGREFFDVVVVADAEPCFVELHLARIFVENHDGVADGFDECAFDGATIHDDPRSRFKRVCGAQNGDECE